MKIHSRVCCCCCWNECEWIIANTIHCATHNMTCNTHETYIVCILWSLCQRAYTCSMLVLRYVKTNLINFEWNVYTFSVEYYMNYLWIYRGKLCALTYGCAVPHTVHIKLQFASRRMNWDCWCCDMAHVSLRYGYYGVRNVLARIAADDGSALMLLLHYTPPQLSLLAIHNPHFV